MYDLRYKQGDIVELNNKIGFRVTEIHKYINYIVIFSNKLNNIHSPVINAIPITNCLNVHDLSKLNPYESEIEIINNKLSTSSVHAKLKINQDDYIVLCEYLNTINKSSLGNVVGHCNEIDFGNINICLSIQGGLLEEKIINIINELLAYIKKDHEKFIAENDVVKKDEVLELLSDSKLQSYELLKIFCSKYKINYRSLLYNNNIDYRKFENR